jgi:hypothetical protein
VVVDLNDLEVTAFSFSVMGGTAAGALDIMAAVLRVCIFSMG